MFFKTHLTKRLFISGIVAMGLAPMAWAQSSDAIQQYPVKPISIVVNFPTGGGTDILARMLSNYFNDALGQTAVIENKPGASGNVGAKYVAEKAPDGYTLSLVTIANFVQRFIQKDLGYDPYSDLAHVTQLTLGVDRDSGIVAGSFDERDPAVKALLSRAISACRSQGKYVGICGQGPSDHPDLAKWLMDIGIQSMSLNPDTVVDTWKALAK